LYSVVSQSRSGGAGALAKYMLNAEHKFKDTSINQSPNNNGVQVLLNGMSQGDTASTRDGNSVKIDKIHLLLDNIKNTSATTTVLRTIVYVAKAPNGSAPAIADVLTPQNENGLYNPINMGNLIKILYDRVHTFENSGKAISITRKNLNHIVHTRFGGTGATISDIQQGAIYLLLISNESTNTPTVQGTTRVMYYDN
jgi:hypothetical protein